MITRVKGVSINTVDNLNVVSTMDLGPQNSDITQAVVAALRSGYAILVSVGTWNIAPITLPENSIIFGFGAKSILRLKDGSNAPALTVTNYVELNNFRLNGNKENQASGGCHGVDLNNSIGVKLNSLNVVNTRGSGIYSSGGVSSTRIFNCKIQGFTESGIKLVSAFNITIDNPYVLDSDSTAVGDGIAITSEGNNISNININNPIINNIIGRGIAVTGSGARNVMDVTIVNPQIDIVNSHGILLMTAAAVTVVGGSVRNSQGDGVRLEGDTINCRVNVVNSKNNNGSGVREVINGATPNYNIFSYNILSGNGNNIPVTVGANSFVV